ncbi:MAG TPA: ferritin family protein [bacterium]|nr:ferritin family protein [bacterium]HOM26698.1 ferritin family protein [bacterium]
MENGIKFAKEFEKHGANLYIEIGMKSENLITKKLFYSLAKQEIEHLEIIENFVLSDDYKTEKTEMIEEDLKEFFTSLKEKNKIESNIDGYKMALEIEKKGYLQYEKFYNEVKNEKEKRLFKFLMEQEKSHIEAIINVYSYLTETGDWFEKEESKIWNWMNM